MSHRHHTEQHDAGSDDRTEQCLLALSFCVVLDDRKRHSSVPARLEQVAVGTRTKLMARTDDDRLDDGIDHGLHPSEMSSQITNATCAAPKSSTKIAARGPLRVDFAEQLVSDDGDP